MARTFAYKYNAQKYIYNILEDSYVKAQTGDKKKYKKEFEKGSLILFDSKKEMEYYFILRDLENKGEIYDLVLQPLYILTKPFTDNTGKKRQAIKYKADFQYETDRENLTVTIDVKGFATDEAKIKRKLFLIAYYNTCKLMWIKYDTIEKKWDSYDDVEKRIRKRKREKGGKK